MLPLNNLDTHSNYTNKYIKNTSIMSKKVIANLTQWLNDNEIIFNNNNISN